MTIAELLLTLFSIMVVYYALKPIQRLIESYLLRLFGARGLHVIDVSEIKEAKSKPSEE